MKLLVTLLTLALSFGAFASVKVGEEAPNFILQSVTGETVNLADYADKTVVLEWTNYGCPFVRKYYNAGAMQELQTTAANMSDLDVVWFSIISSAKGKQGYLEANEEGQAAVANESFNGDAVLLDPTGETGKAYGATNTPHMFVIQHGRIAYEGAIDSIPSVNPVDLEKAQNYVMDALMNLSAGEPVATAQTKAYGCSIKY